jgi:predicted nucleic acid-binding protein
MNDEATRLPFNSGYERIGILGILLRAKSAGHLAAVRPILDALQRNAGFWLSEPLRRQVLGAAGEQT